MIATKNRQVLPAFHFWVSALDSARFHDAWDSTVPSILFLTQSKQTQDPLMRNDLPKAGVTVLQLSHAFGRVS